MLKLRNGIYYADISIAGKARVVKSCFTQDKRQAQEYHDRLTAELWRTATLKEKPKYTWLDAVDLWLKLKAKKRTIEDDKDKLRFMGEIMNGLLLKDIDSSVINRVRDAKLKDGVSDATINRYMALIRSMLNLARANEMIETIPSFSGKIVSENRERIVYLSKEQAARLYEYIPNNLKDCYKFALLTGLRKSNVFNLKWNSVDIERACAWVKSEDAKGKKSIAIPLNSSALELIKNIKATHSPSQFVFGGVKPLEMKGWRRIVRQSGVGDEIMRDFGVELRWHDLRHTWATWHVMAGTPLGELQKLGGWKSYAMVLKYGHFAPAHLAQYANNAGF